MTPDDDVEISKDTICLVVIDRVDMLVVTHEDYLTERSKQIKGVMVRGKCDSFTTSVPFKICENLGTRSTLTFNHAARKFIMEGSVGVLNKSERRGLEYCWNEIENAAYKNADIYHYDNEYIYTSTVEWRTQTILHAHINCLPYFFDMTLYLEKLREGSPRFLQNLLEVLEKDID